MNFLLYDGFASETAKLLIAELQSLGIDISGGTKPPPKAGDHLIRYGSRVPLGGQKWNKVINKADAIKCASDKMRTLLTLLDNGIQEHPRIWTPASPDLKFPVYGRRFEHTKGQDIQVCLCRGDLEWAVSHDPKSEYFVEYVAVKDEYRIHVVGGKRIRTSIKYLADPSLRSPFVRNVDSGWKFRHPESHEKPPPKLQLAAKYAIDMLGLDFGAVDCAVLDDGHICIFEVNTAPGLATSDQGVQLYAKALAKELS